MTLPPPLRRDLQPARGRVYRGVALLNALRGRESLSCVGDVVSNYCVRASPRRLVAVVDGRTRRSPLTGNETGFTRDGWDLVLRVSNPPGQLDPAAASILCSLSRAGPEWVLVLVDGEEDMLAIPLMACGKSPVVYGLPGVGGVVVEPSPAARLASSMWMALLALAPGKS